MSPDRETAKPLGREIGLSVYRHISEPQLRPTVRPRNRQAAKPSSRGTAKPQLLQAAGLIWTNHSLANVLVKTPSQSGRGLRPEFSGGNTEGTPEELGEVAESATCFDSV